jgi:hypothetical protein
VKGVDLTAVAAQMVAVSMVAVSMVVVPMARPDGAAQLVPMTHFSGSAAPS